MPHLRFAIVLWLLGVALCYQAAAQTSEPLLPDTEIKAFQEKVKNAQHPLSIRLAYDYIGAGGRDTNSYPATAYAYLVLGMPAHAEKELAKVPLAVRHREDVASTKEFGLLMTASMELGGERKGRYAAVAAKLEALMATNQGKVTFYGCITNYWPGDTVITDDALDEWLSQHWTLKAPLSNDIVLTVPKKVIPAGPYDNNYAMKAGLLICHLEELKLRLSPFGPVKIVFTDRVDRGDAIGVIKIASDMSRQRRSTSMQFPGLKIWEINKDYWVEQEDVEFRVLSLIYGK